MIWKPFFNLSPANIATHFSTKSKRERERERRKNTAQVVDMHWRSQGQAILGSGPPCYQRLIKVYMYMVVSLKCPARELDILSLPSLQSADINQ